MFSRVAYDLNFVDGVRFLKGVFKCSLLVRDQKEQRSTPNPIQIYFNITLLLYDAAEHNDHQCY